MDYDYRDILKRELQQRCSSNALYSQRAFAKKLGLTQGGLSEVLAKRRGLSLDRAEQIVKKLGFNLEESEIFCESVRSQHARSPAQRKSAKSKLSTILKSGQYSKLSTDEFEFIQEWYYLAILELTQVDGFKSNAEWISGELGLPVVQCQEAVDRLLRMGLLSKGRDGKLALTHKKLEIQGHAPSNAIKNFHLQVMNKAQKSVYGQSRDERSLNSIYCAIDPEDLPKARKMIDEFWKNFCRTMRKTEKKDKVYCLSVQFFDVKE